MSKCCIKCGTKLGEEDLFCGNCGELETSEIHMDASMESKTTKNIDTRRKFNVFCKRKVFKLIVVVIILTVVLGKCSNYSTEYEVKETAKDIISERLYSPHSAVFSEVILEESDKYGRHIVTLTVDSQNRYGAMIRTRWGVVFRIEGNYYYWNNNLSIQEYDEDWITKEECIEDLKKFNDWNEPVEEES